MFALILKHRSEYYQCPGNVIESDQLARMDY